MSEERPSLSISPPQPATGRSHAPEPAQLGSAAGPGAAPPVSGPTTSTDGHVRTRSQPTVTWVLIAINVLLWLAMLPFGGSSNPAVLVWFGAKVNSLIVQGQFWRLLTPIFLHVGIVHLAFNTYALFIFGPQIERFFGAARFLVIYLLSGICGVLLSFVFSPHPAAGASGAIFGLIGTEVVFFYRYRNVFGQRGRQQLYNLLFIVAYNIIMTVTVPNIDVWGHAGGLLAGTALGWGLMPYYAVAMTERGPAVVDRNRPARWGLVALGAMLVLMLGAGLTIALRAKGA